MDNIIIEITVKIQLVASIFMVTDNHVFEPTNEPTNELTWTFDADGDCVMYDLTLD